MRERRGFALGSVLLVMVMWLPGASPAQAQPPPPGAFGTLDTSFATGGRLIMARPGTNILHSVVVQDDGKSVSVGFDDVGPTQFWAVLRLNSDGTPDETFGTHGLIDTNPGGNGGSAYAIAVQPDGKLLVTGSNQEANGLYKYTVVRYLPTGQLDLGFGVGGVAKASPGADVISFALALQPDGKVVVAGHDSTVGGSLYDFGLSRFNADGTLDITFGSSGFVRTNFTPGNYDSADSLAVQPDGKIVAAGSDAPFDGPSFSALARYASDGTLDASFGAGGRVKTTADAVNSETARAVRILADGRIVTAGDTFGLQADLHTVGGDVVLTQFTPAGGLDPTFGISGRVRTSIGLSYAIEADGMVLESGGNIVIAGINQPPQGAPATFLLAEYTPKGVLNTVATPGNGLARGYGVALQADGKVLVAGEGGSAFGHVNIAIGRFFGGGAPFVVITPTSLDGADGSPGDHGVLDFGNERFGATSAAQKLTITNGGTTNLVIDHVVKPAGFVVTNGGDQCSKMEVEPNKSCTIAVAFAPTRSPTGLPTVINYSPQMEIVDNAADSPQLVSLEGTGVNVSEAPLTEAEQQTNLESARTCNLFTKQIGWQLIDSQRPLVSLKGQVVQGHISFTDANINHYAADYNFFVYPDHQPMYTNLLGKPGNWIEGDKLERGRIEVEWERSNSDPLAAAAGGIPEWAWPTQGDRVFVVGNHIWDCGHGHVTGLRSEIHPPRLVVVYRNAALAPFAGADGGRLGSYFDPGDGSGLLWATQADVYASSYGGLAIQSESGIAPTPFTKAAGTGWWQPVNDRDYTFIVRAPPQPSADAELMLWQRPHLVPQGALEAPLTTTKLPDGSGYLVTVKFSQVAGEPNQLMVFADTLYVAWKKAPDPWKPHLVHYRVTLKDLTIDRRLSDRWGLYAYVNGQGGPELNLGGTSPLGEPFDRVLRHTRVNSFLRPTFDVTLVDGQPLHIQFRTTAFGSFNPIFGGSNDFPGVVEYLSSPHGPPNLSGDHNGVAPNTEAAGAEDVAHKCAPPRGPCFTVSYSIAKQP